MNIPLWLYRPLLNWRDVYRWAIEDGLEEMLSPNQLHATIATARSRVDWDLIKPLHDDELTVEATGMVLLGDSSNVRCIGFESDVLAARHAEIRSLMTIDFADQFIPHVTLNRDHPVEPRQPYRGVLVFGGEVAAPFIASDHNRCQPVNRNQYRVPLGFPEHCDKTAKKSEWRTMEKMRKANAEKKRRARVPQIGEYL